VKKAGANFRRMVPIAINHRAMNEDMIINAPMQRRRFG
jgi:hypothetical protein